jgi:hypothetical protein
VGGLQPDDEFEGKDGTPFQVVAFAGDDQIAVVKEMNTHELKSVLATTPPEQVALDMQVVAPEDVSSPTPEPEPIKIEVVSHAPAPEPEGPKHYATTVAQLSEGDRFIYDPNAANPYAGRTLVVNGYQPSGGIYAEVEGDEAAHGGLGFAQEEDVLLIEWDGATDPPAAPAPDGWDRVSLGEMMENPLDLDGTFKFTPDSTEMEVTDSDEETIFYQPVGGGFDSTAPADTEVYAKVADAEPEPDAQPPDALLVKLTELDQGTHFLYGDEEYEVVDAGGYGVDAKRLYDGKVVAFTVPDTLGYVIKDPTPGTVEWEYPENVVSRPGEVDWDEQVEPWKLVEPYPMEDENGVPTAGVEALYNMPNGMVAMDKNGDSVLVLTQGPQQAATTVMSENGDVWTAEGSMRLKPLGVISEDEPDTGQVAGPEPDPTPAPSMPSVSAEQMVGQSDGEEGAFTGADLYYQLKDFDLIPTGEDTLDGYKSNYGSGGKYKHYKLRELFVGDQFRDKSGHIFTVLTATGKAPKDKTPAWLIVYDHNLGAPLRVSDLTRVRRVND